ncbi:Crp/Fnr family transcriptional regulator [Marinobacterium arenosum]|uniref:Crp/Fnr family transcriptional regulator n=1 Tax=Marinobacterium arenosum TaxID=2862496 RepID=UPI001C97A4CF|nr:Crp/Fnr family transcriptional regulator [Marinobacterium arenosum]MBY4676379.1 Crp/Fnr family transcriptional regulator [Marinobacterium arenosum]
MSPSELEQALQKAHQHPLFNALNPEQFHRLEERVRVIDLAAGESLFRQGEQAERFYMVVRGTMKVFRLSSDGQEKIIEVIGSGETLAEAVMFLDKPAYPANADAVEASQVLVFSSQVYKSLLAESSDCCFKVMAALAIRLHSRLKEIETLTLQNARHRVGRFLCSLLPPDCGEQSEIQLPVAKRLIAARLAMQPETFSRIMHDLKERQLVEVHGRKLLIRDVAALQQLT